MNTPASVNFGWTVASGLVGALLALVLKHLYDRWQSHKTRRRRAGALRAEINYCARLARTYLTEGYTAPLYRFPNAVFDSMYPHLLSDALTEMDIEALTGFFSLVDQMNRGLDAVERYRAAKDQDHAEEEIRRLMAKAEQMAHPTDASRIPGENLRYYAGAIAAVDRHAQ